MDAERQSENERQFKSHVRTSLSCEVPRHSLVRAIGPADGFGVLPGPKHVRCDAESPSLGEAFAWASEFSYPPRVTAAQSVSEAALSCSSSEHPRQLQLEALRSASVGRCSAGLIEDIL